MTQVLIVANGEWPKSYNIEEYPNDYSLLIALDGAANRLAEHGLLPDVLVGDMDSIDPEILAQCRLNDTEIIHDANQEQSDISKGLRWVHQNHPDSEINIVGVEIGRYDHHLAAFSSLFEQKSSAIVILEGWDARRVGSIPQQVNVQPGCLVSLISFGTVTGVNLSGCQYSLHDETMHTGTRGVSNTAIETTITISAKSGDLLLLIQR